MAIKANFLTKTGDYTIKDAYINIHSIRLIRPSCVEMVVVCYKDKDEAAIGNFIERKMYTIDNTHAKFQDFMGDWALEQKKSSPFINAYKFLKTKDEFKGYTNIFEGEEGWPDEERTKPQPDGV